MQYRKENVRNRILAAARDEYLAKGYHDTKINDIAKKADVPIGNLYRYFDGKTALLDAIVQKTYDEIPEYIETMLESHERLLTPLPEFMALLTSNLTELFERHGEELVILADKCGGTKYTDFNDKLFCIVNKYYQRFLFPSPTKAESVFCRVVSKAFVTSILDILMGGESEAPYSDTINRFLVFIFFDVRKRV